MGAMKRLDAVQCRACGATHAKPHENKWGVCATCWGRVKPSDDSDGLAEVMLLQHFTSKLSSAAKRIHKGKPVHRCECISRTEELAPAYQCSTIANYKRDGRYVCHSHYRSESVTFVDQIAESQRDILKGVLENLYFADPDVLECMKEIVDTPPTPPEMPKKRDWLWC